MTSATHKIRKCEPVNDDPARTAIPSSKCRAQLEPEAGQEAGEFSTKLGLSVLLRERLGVWSVIATLKDPTRFYFSCDVVPKCKPTTS